MAEGPFSATVIFPTQEIIEAVIVTAGGPPGSPGAAATVSVASTATGVAGTSAMVANTGTSTHAVLNFTIPRGATGSTGAGVPTGGTVNQALTKIDSTNYNTQWVSLPTADAVSARLVSVSAELGSVIASGDAFLSARITSAEAIAGVSVTSAKVATASAAATSADAHANTVSARVVSVSAELVSLLTSASAALESHASAASAAATSANAHAATASAAATSADFHANVASAAATSVDAHVNTVSARVVSVSSELASIVQIASAAATSADAHANTVSARAVSISNELGSVIASGDAFLSARITSAEAVGGGTVTHTGGALTSNAVVLGADAGDTKVAPGITTDGANVLNLGQPAAALGQIQFFNTVGGNLYLRPIPTSALGTNNVINLPIEANGFLATEAFVRLASANIQSTVNTASAAATSADAHANTVSARVVSVSSELASIVQVASVAATSADAHAATASAAATSADAHANAVSARVVSASAELASLMASADAALSVRIDGVSSGGGGSATSAEVYSIVQGYSTTATAAGITTLVAGSPPEEFFTGVTTQTVVLPVTSTLVLGKQYLIQNDSTGVVTVQSSGANSIVAMAGGSAAVFTCILTSGTTAASWSYRYSNTATDVVSARAVSISNELGSLLASTSAALETHAAAASAAATSADAHANTVSARAVSISAELASLVQVASAAATSADGHANTVSARVVSVSAELASLMNSADSFLSLRITSAEGLVGGGGSVTSQEVYSIVQGYSTIGTSASTTAVVAGTPPELFFTGSTTQTVTLPDVTTLVLGKQYLIKNDSTGIVTVQSSGANTIVAMAGGSSAVFTCIAITGTGTASWSYGYSNTASDVVSARLVSVSAELASLINVSVSALSNRVTSVSNELGSLLASASAALEIHASTASAAATSADAHANTVSARAVSISAELASLVQIASAAATSADGHANTVSARVVSVSAELASMVQIASAAATSADGHANTLSARVVSVSAELASLINVSVSVLSNRVTSVSAELASLIQGYSTIATAAGTTAVVAATPPEIFFTGSTTQTVTLPDVTTLVLGKQYLIQNDSSGVVTVQSSGANTIVAMAGLTAAVFTCIAITGTGTSSWSYRYSNTATDVVSAQLVSVSAALTSQIAASVSVLSNRVTSVSNELGSLIAVSVSVLSNRVTSVSNELGSIIASQTARRAVNTAAQISITVSAGSTVSGVSIALVNGQSYAFEFNIPFVANSAAGIVVGVVSPTVTAYAAQYTIPSSVAATGVLPAAANMITFASPTTNTKYSTVSITLTGVTLNVNCVGTIVPSASGSLKFLIGPGTTNVANNGLLVQQGANLRVWRTA